ncbi:MAG: aminotransferase class I/II-fold pyridoxal phosphate-dependent enzyme [Robiginitomaculum sp.]|nr:aminotransferase class I/II-fold pyridoxal phosphate-dependent enzyme [Robiginitomaculum sp.]
MTDTSKTLARQVLVALETYRSDSEAGNSHVLKQKPPAQLSSEMGLAKWIRTGGLNAANVGAFLNPYLEHSQHMHHPGFIGHQVAVPHEGAAIADMVHGVINNPMAVYEMGPTASVIERVVVNWMLEKCGWFSGAIDGFEPNPNNGAGVLTHGGSLANLTAVLAARAHATPNAWRDGTPDDLAIIAPAATHYSLARAVSIAGFGQNAIRYAPVNGLEVLQPEKLEQTFLQAQNDGQKVFMVSANACTTATGLYDPIDEVAEFCERHNLWLHVDGAHGASALLSDKERHLMRGINRADSLTWDAHKMMRTPALCAAILFKDQKSMAGTFHQDASYIFYGTEDQIGFDVGPYAVECTKSALGAKLFWVLAMEGEKAMGRFVEKQYKDTRAFYELINAQGDFTCPYRPEANILCFKYDGVDDNEAQLALREKILKRGSFYITTAEINGVRYLRLSVMNPLTSVETIEELLAEIRLCAA